MDSARHVLEENHVYRLQLVVDTAYYLNWANYRNFSVDSTQNIVEFAPKVKIVKVA